MRQLTDARSVPVTKIGDEVLVGFHADLYAQALAPAAAAQTGKGTWAWRAFAPWPAGVRGWPWQRLT